MNDKEEVKVMVTDIVTRINSYKNGNTNRSWKMRNQELVFDNEYITVVRVDSSNKCNRLHEHILSDQTAILLHNEVKFPDKRRIISKYMDHIMLAASRLVYVPE